MSISERDAGRFALSASLAVGLVLGYGYTLTLVHPEALGLDPAQPSARTLLTSVVVHTGFLHAAANVGLLAVFGPTIERASRLALAGVVAAAWLGAAAAVWHLRIGTEPVVGASGITAGVTAAAAVLGAGPVRWLALLVALALIAAAFVPGLTGTSIAHESHLGGIVGGSLVALGAAAHQERARRGPTR